MSDKLYSLMPLEDFKSVLGIDDRDDKTSRFCLITASLEIENYCRRHLLSKKFTEVIYLYDDLCLPLKEFPVNKICSVYSMRNEHLAMSNGNLIEPEFYRIYPDVNNLEDIPYFLCLSPAVLRMGCKAVKVNYNAGYALNPHPCGFNARSFCDAKTPTNRKAASVPPIPADLSAACLELAMWKFNRYKGRRVGFTGSVKRDGEKFEISMPENVKTLIDPYVRRTI